MANRNLPFIKVNGVSFPAPKRGLSMQVVTIVDSGRAANGRIISQRIGRDQQKLNNMVWPWLDAETWSKLLQELEKFDLVVEYVDPVKNDWVTRRMYPGDRSGEPYWLGPDNKPTYYLNCQCNLIDRGEDD